jgi:aminopeptidase B
VKGGKGVLELLGERYGFRGSHNAEIQLRWSQIIIKNGLMSSLPEVERFLKSQGKQKFTLSIYRALVKGGPEMKDFGVRVFGETRLGLHINVRKYVRKILEDKEGATA